MISDSLGLDYVLGSRQGTGGTADRRRVHAGSACAGLTGRPKQDHEAPEDKKHQQIDIFATRIKHNGLVKTRNAEKGTSQKREVTKHKTSFSNLFSRMTSMPLE
jgi:hypothetical protein